jgi:hypothetical protein
VYADRGKSCSSNKIVKMELTSQSYSDVIVESVCYFGAV